MIKEEWRPVVGYDGLYEVSNLGRVKSYWNGNKKILKPYKANNGYLQVSLCKDGIKSTWLVHRLVYEAFYGTIPAEMEIDHIDTNRQNNSVDNLRCVTHRENQNNQSTLNRLKEACKKRSQNKEWRRNQTESMRKLRSNPAWLKNHDEAMKKLHSDQDYQNKRMEACKKACNKPVNQYTLDGVFVKAWPSMTYIEIELGFGKSHISKCCNGKQKSAYGSIWRHAT